MSYGSSGNNCKIIFDNAKSGNLAADDVRRTNFRGSYYGMSLKILYLALKIVYKVDLSDAVMFQYYHSSSISILVEIIIQNCKVAFNVQSSCNGCTELTHLKLKLDAEIQAFSTELFVQASRISSDSNCFFRFWWNPYALDCKTFPGISMLCLHEFINNQESASNIDTQSQIMDLTL